MFDLTAFLNDPAGLALKALLVTAALDFIFGVLAAIRDGSFQLIAVAAVVVLIGAVAFSKRKKEAFGGGDLQSAATAVD